MIYILGLKPVSIIVYWLNIKENYYSNNGILNTNWDEKSPELNLLETNTKSHLFNI